MTHSVTANQVSGRAVGAMFFTVFGALWFVLALYARQQLGTTSVATVATIAVLLTATALYLRNQAKRFPHVPEDPAMGRAFGWVNAVQWIAIIVAATAFPRLHWDAYLMSAITLIVGLHMFPLARLFRYPLHYATGGLLVAWAAASIAVAPAGELQSTTALGTGTILWLSAAVTLAMALLLTRRASATVAVADCK